MTTIPLALRACLRNRCGKTLPTPRRLKDFCSYSCRGQSGPLQLPMEQSYQSALVRSKNTKRNSALQSLKRQVRRSIYLCPHQLAAPSA